MKTRTGCVIGVCVLAAAAMWGCGGGGGGTTARITRVVTGQIEWPSSLGAVADATVAVHEVKAVTGVGAAVKAGTVGPTGRYRVELSSSEVMEVRVTGKSGGITVRLAALIGAQLGRGRQTTEIVRDLNGGTTLGAAAADKLLKAGKPLTTLTPTLVANLEAAGAQRAADTDFTNAASLDQAATAVLETTSDGTKPPVTQYELVGHFGEGQLSSGPRPAVAPTGDLYVADFWLHRVQVFDRTGLLRFGWGVRGPDPGQLELPEALTVDPTGNVYVADGGNDRIQKFTSAGVFVAAWGGSGTGEGQFDTPSGVALDSQGNLYVTDFGNHRVQKLAPDGTFVTAWGSRGSGDSQLEFPFGIAIDRLDHVFVTDRQNQRVLKFSTTGVLLGKWGSAGTANDQFEWPWGIAVDRNTDVYVCDHGHNCVKKFTSGGVFLCKFGALGSPDAPMERPFAVAVDDRGYVYVGENGRPGTIQVWRPVQ